jgi:hypothetical protein
LLEGVPTSVVADRWARPRGLSERTALIREYELTGNRAAQLDPPTRTRLVVVDATTPA